MTSAEAKQPTESGDLPDTRPSLLIADDDAFMRSALTAQLKDAVRIVAVAADASAAIALAEEHQPAAALLDVDMPNGGAREAVPQIAARSPATSIVILSGDETREIVLELISAGAIAYVRKGVSGSELSQTLSDAIEAKRDPPTA
jgi:DNA-binding NarL/FixJ family response regulator